MTVSNLSALFYTHRKIRFSHILAQHLKNVVPQTKSIVVPLGLPKMFTFKPSAYNPNGRCELLLLTARSHKRTCGVFRNLCEMLRIWQGSRTPVLRIIGNPENISERDLWAKASALGLSEQNLQITTSGEKSSHSVF